MALKFLTGKAYSDRLQEMLASDGRLCAAVAFWGQGAEDIVSKSGRRSIPAQILCNLQSGACNPYVIEKLMGLDDIEVRTSPLLHAKVVITDGAALVGSANISANGLSLEGARAAWDEAGVYCTDEVLRRDAQAWFDQQWEDAINPNFPLAPMPNGSH
jgi:phosphatidylserine/phosphatidylglycerophosphate/cardiolipin synthase-like enzyme